MHCRYYKNEDSSVEEHFVGIANPPVNAHTQATRQTVEVTDNSWEGEGAVIVELPSV